MARLDPKRLRNSSRTVLQPYQAKKYNVQVLPDLTQKEIDKLAASQAARGDA